MILTQLDNKINNKIKKYEKKCKKTVIGQTIMESIKKMKANAEAKALLDLEKHCNEMADTLEKLNG